jgi:predicted dehydrogenase
MEQAELRGGLVGCGFFARNHLHAWKQVAGAGITALCDQDLARARAYSREFGIAAVFDDLGAMLASGALDFVDVVTQPAAHRAIVEAAARRGLNVICQKPLAPSLEDARGMAEACRSAGVRFMVHENFRWQRCMRALKRLSAHLGELFFARIRWRSGFDVYASQPYLATDPRFIIYDLGVHLLDLARFFLGEAAELYCHAQRVNPGVRAEDAATILLKMRSGAACVVELSFASRLAADLFPQTLVHLEGARGSATLGPHFQITGSIQGAAFRQSAAPEIFPWSRPPAEAIQESVAAIQQHWADCCRGGLEPETSAADNLRTLELVFGAYESAATGNPYKVQATS